MGTTENHLRSLLQMALLFGILVGGAHAVTVSPAMTTQDLERIAEKTRTPKTSQPVHVLCDTGISSSGKFEYVMCVSRPEGMKEHEQAAIRALKKVRVKPAELDGKRVRAYTPVSIVFLPGEKTKVIAVPNDGRQVDKFGFDYTAPQRLNRLSWACSSDESRRLARTGKGCNSRGTKFVLELNIDAAGKVTDCKVHDMVEFAQLVGDVCAQSHRYIPGIVNGKPTPMIYIEPLWSS